MKTRQLTCIICPRGCQLTVTMDEAGAVVGVTGNTCKRGAAYGEMECTHPERTVTSTVRTKEGRVVSVKTKTPVPKDKIFEVMDAINAARPALPLHVGDVVIANVCATGVPVVVTEDAE